MKFEVEIPEEAITGSIKAGVAQFISQYFYGAGEGFKRVQAEIRDQLYVYDVTPVCKRILAAKCDEIALEVITEELRRRYRKTVKTMTTEVLQKHIAEKGLL